MVTSALIRSGSVTESVLVLASAITITCCQGSTAGGTLVKAGEAQTSIPLLSYPESLLYIYATAASTGASGRVALTVNYGQDLG